MKLTIGIIGAGVIGNRIAGWCQSISELRIKWICDLDQDRAKSLADLSEAKTTNDYNKLINDQELDIIYIGIPPKWHAEISIKALKAGKHVVCEKPLSLRIEDGKKMIEAAENSGKITNVNLPLRWSKSFQHFKKLLVEGYCGNILTIKLKFRFHKWPRKFQEQALWLKHREQGGALREVATHFVFLLQELKGMIGKPAKVWAIHQREEAKQAENSTLGIIKFDSGLTCLVDLLIGSNEKDENTLTIIGSDGLLSFRDWNDVYGSHNQKEQELLYDERYPGINAISEFIKQISGHDTQQPLVTFTEARNAQIVIESLIKSDGSWIDLRF